MMSDVSSFSFVLSGAWAGSQNKWGDLGAESNMEWFGSGGAFKDHLVPVFAQSPVQPDREHFQRWGISGFSGLPLPSVPLLPASNRKARQVVLA